MYMFLPYLSSTYSISHIETARFAKSQKTFVRLKYNFLIQKFEIDSIHSQVERHIRQSITSTSVQASTTSQKGMPRLILAAAVSNPA